MILPLVTIFEMDILPIDCLHSFMLHLSYRDLLIWSCVCRYAHSLFRRPYLWTDKTYHEYGVSASSQLQYLCLLSERGGCEPGSEQFLPSRKCLRRAGKQGDRRLIRYFEKIFNRRDTLSHLVAGATKVGNLSLVKELVATHPNGLIDIHTFIAKDIGRSGKREIVDYFGLPHITNPYLPRASAPPEIDRDYIRSLCESAGRSGDASLIEYLNSMIKMDCLAVAIGAIMGSKTSSSDAHTSAGHVDIFHTYLGRYHTEHPTNYRHYCYSLDTAIKYQCNAIIPYLIDKIDERDRFFIHEAIYRAAKYNRHDILTIILSKNIHSPNDINLGLWGASAGGHILLIDFFIEKGAHDLVGALNVCIKHYPKTKSLAIVDHLMAKIRQSIPDFDFRDVIDTVIERGDTDLFARFQRDDLDLIRDPRSLPHYVVKCAIHRSNIILIRRILDVRLFHLQELKNFCIESIEYSRLEALEIFLPLYVEKARENGLIYVLEDLARYAHRDESLLSLDYLIAQGADISKLHVVPGYLTEINEYLQYKKLMILNKNN